jgi:tetratricopeptide (TPR) repeat protein
MLVAVLMLGAFIPMIAQAGHVGGLLGGLAIAAGLIKESETSARTAHILGLGILLLLGLAARAPTWRTEYHTLLGFRLLEDGRSDDALRSFEIALQQAPSDVELANAVAYELSLSGRELARALALVNNALVSDPENPDYLDTKGWILCRQGHSSEGRRWLQRAIDASDTPNDEIVGHVQTCSRIPATAESPRATR